MLCDHHLGQPIQHHTAPEKLKAQISCSRELPSHPSNPKPHAFKAEGPKTHPTDPSVRCAAPATLSPRPQVVYVEAISNPLMEVPDLPRVAAFARQHSLTTVIDATFATPVLLRPAVQLGFDLVIHSATKYLNGHSDVIAGTDRGGFASFTSYLCGTDIHCTSNVFKHVWHRYGPLSE